MTQAYPLQWPEGWPQTKPSFRQGGGKFIRKSWKGGSTQPTIKTTRTELANELHLLGARSVILSTNVELRLDGMPYSNRRAPEDPGIAVYFLLGGDQMVMAQDAYRRVPDNIRSLTLAISGMRQMKRHGGGTMLKRAFAGFSALPPPSAASDAPDKVWWVVLGVSANADAHTIREAYKAACRDAGGATVELNAAKEAGLRGVRS